MRSFIIHHTAKFYLNSFSNYLRNRNKHTSSLQIPTFIILLFHHRVRHKKAYYKVNHTKRNHINLIYNIWTIFKKTTHFRCNRPSAALLSQQIHNMSGKLIARILVLVQLLVVYLSDLGELGAVVGVLDRVIWLGHSTFSCSGTERSHANPDPVHLLVCFVLFYISFMVYFFLVSKKKTVLYLILEINIGLLSIDNDYY